MVEYEILNLDYPGLSEGLKVPSGAVQMGVNILNRFYEPNHVKVPSEEINTDSRMGHYRKS